MSDTTVRIAKLGANHLREDDVIIVDSTRYTVRIVFIVGQRVGVEAIALAGPTRHESLSFISGELVDIEIC